MAGAIHANEIFFIPAHKPRFAVLAGNDNFKIRLRSDMPADLKQHDIVQFIIALAARLP